MIWFVRVAIMAAVLVAWGGPGGPSALAQTPAETNEKSAFETAKELGTPDAWAAFLKNFPTGFHADMARAYLKKLGEPASSAATASLALPPSSARAAERACSERRVLRSERSTEPTKITFVNNSGLYRSISWIDFEGRLQSYGGVNSGDSVTFDTYRSHPWEIATGPGDCLQIFLPAAEPATVELVRMAADDPPKRPNQPNQPPRSTSNKQQVLKCAENYKLVNGQCVLQQNCGANAFRSPEGDCYCKQGYQRVNGVCAWPTNKQGFEIAPWNKPGCQTLKAQCGRGVANACKRYEESCQVN